MGRNFYFPSTSQKKILESCNKSFQVTFAKRGSGASLQGQGNRSRASVIQ